MSESAISDIYPADKPVSMTATDLAAARSEPSGEQSGLTTRIGSKTQLRDTIAGLNVKVGVDPTRKKTKKHRPMLTSSQLSDLFTRLDKNGDGELDLDEFSGIIKMLKINVTQDYISRVFRTVDQASGGGGDVAGTLDMQEFIAAYQKIYCGATLEEPSSNTIKRESFVRATRYGCRADGSYIFECYTISSDGKSEIHALGDLPTNQSLLGSDFGETENFTKLSQAKVDAWVVDGKPGKMDHLDVMIRADSERNKSSKASVLWWVDVAYSSVDSSTTNELVDKFGLPNDTKFASSFGNFGNGLPSHPKSRMFAGKGVYGNAHRVSSLSMFAQALYIKNLPVVHHLPPLLRSLQCSVKCSTNFFSRLTDFLVQYYTSRFAWMANLSWLSRSSSDEKIGAYERAEGLASLIKTSDVDTYDDADDDESVVPEMEEDDEDDDVEIPGDNHTIFSSNGSGVPIKHRAGYNYPPTWLRSNSQLYALPPHISIDSLSLHILDHGYGPHTLLTVRQIDPEKQKRFTLEQQSRAGVLGRIISGVWVKLASVVMSGRSAGVAGEMTDSPSALVTFLLMLIHNFSMNSAASIDYWLNALEKEIKDIVVSKHSAHLGEVERILKDFNSYLEPFESLMQTMAAEQEEFLDKEEEQNQIEKEAREASDDEADVPIRVPYSRSGSVKIQSGASTISGTTRKRRISLPGTIGEGIGVEALPDGVEKISLSFSTIGKFFGKHSYREIHRHLDGYEQLDIKGLTYGKERLRKYSLKVEALKELISTQLDEKRNFMSFMLTIITTILAPLAILTGYFGMNFDNMSELDHTTYPKAPGVTLLWIICGVAYGLLLLVALHFRVLYAAT